MASTTVAPAVAIGNKPATWTQADWKAAADKLNAQKSAGLARNYHEQSYINAARIKIGRGRDD